MKLALIAALPTAAMLSCCPALAQQVRARADVTTETIESGTFYYNNESVIWQNGKTTVLPGVLNSAHSVSAEDAGGKAFSYANIETGKVGGSAFGIGDNYASARSIYQDMITFSVADVDANTITPIRFIASLHTETPTFYSATYSVGFNDGGGQFVYKNRLGDYWWTDISGSRLGSFNTWVDGDTQYFDVIYNIVGSSHSAYFGMDLSVMGGHGQGTYMYHTAGVKFDLPSNVAMTSSTGLFLTTGAVPEPGTWMMMILGFGAVGYAMRRRTVPRYV